MVPILDDVASFGERFAENETFADGATDDVDADPRHGLIVEPDFRRSSERGYGDEDEVEDWADTQAQVDHFLLDVYSNWRH